MTEQTTLQFSIEGMTCASCVGRVEKAMAAVDGVNDVSINLAQAQATVRVSGANPAKIAAASTAAGYTAKPIVDAADKARADAAKHAQALQLQRLTIIAAALTLPVFVMEMGGHLFPSIHHFIARTIGLQTSWLIQFTLTTIVLAWPGAGFFRKGIPALFRGAPDMNALVAMGTGAAWIFSTVAVFAPALLPAGTRAVYFESAAVIVTLILFGRLLEARAKGRTGDAIRKLIGLRPKTATVERDGQTTEVAVEDIIAGDLIHLRPGEKLAVDGVVTKGASYIDESMITGEPVPVEKTLGAEVTGGTINGTGALTYRATSVGEDTVLAQIIRMVSEAQAAKLPIQDLVNRITLWFVPAVMLVALITVISWFVFGPDPALSFALVAGVAVLIIACPCAMGLATPTSIMVGTGRAAELGVLFRQGDALQALHEVKTVAVDKTGTLTAGRPELTDLIVTNGFAEEEVLALVGAVEASSEHPIAQAIVRRAGGGPFAALDTFKSITGFGVAATVAGRNILVGADRLMAREGIAMDEYQQQADTFAAAGKTPLYAAIDGTLAAVIAVSDPIKPNTPKAIDALHAMGLRVVMITGDNAATAQAIANTLKIDEFFAETLPADKVTILANLPGPLAFVGDGINDAPALAQADVGIAIGTGTDIAMEAADVVLMSGDLGGVVNAIRVSQQTMRNIRQNLFWAFGYNTLLIPVAAGVFYPLFGVLLSPALAAGAMAMSSVFVLSNALRLRWVKSMIGGTA